MLMGPLFGRPAGTRQARASKMKYSGASISVRLEKWGGNCAVKGLYVISHFRARFIFLSVWKYTMRKLHEIYSRNFTGQVCINGIILNLVQWEL